MFDENRYGNDSYCFEIFGLLSLLLAHQSRRLVGELIVYGGIQGPASVVCQHFQTTSPLKP